MRLTSVGFVVMGLTLFTGCSALDGNQGQQGIQGEPGRDGVPGPPGPQPAGSTVSGERIKARFLVSDDGAKTPVGWVDSDINIPCAFVLASDGNTRCLPVVPKSDIYRVMYEKSDCSGAGIALGSEQNASPCAANGPYVEDRQHVPCNAGIDVYTVGGKFAGQDPIFYSDGTGCFANFSYKFDFYRIDLVDPSVWVAANEKIQ